MLIVNVVKTTTAPFIFGINNVMGIEMVPIMVCYTEIVAVQ